MKNILLLTDFSKASQNAIRYAIQLFQGKQCDFHLLHISDLSTYLVDDLVVPIKSVNKVVEAKSSEQKLEKMIEQLQSEFNTQNFKFYTIVKYDYLITTVNKIIESEKIDLIVMGSNGVTGAQEVLFGSNTINVIRKVKCTTLVIPEGYEFKNPNEVLIPLSQNDSIADNAFIDAKIFMKDFAKKLHLLRVSLKKDVSYLKKDKDYINHLLTDIDCVYKQVADVPLHHLINTYVQLNQIDLLALLAHKETIFERLFYGSETKKLSNKNLLPLLIFHTN